MVKLGTKAGGGVSSKFTSWKRNKSAKVVVKNNDNVNGNVAAAATPNVTKEEVVEQRVDNEAVANTNDESDADDDANVAEDEREQPEPLNDDDEDTEDKENELDAALSSSLLRPPSLANISMSKSRSNRSNRSIKSLASLISTSSRKSTNSSSIRSIEVVQEREGTKAMFPNNTANNTDIPSPSSVASSIHSTSMNSYVTSASRTSQGNPINTIIPSTSPSKGSNTIFPGPNNSPRKLHAVPLSQRLKERETQLKNFKKKVRILTGFGNAVNVTSSGGTTNDENTEEDGTEYNLRECHPTTTCGDVEDLVSGAIVERGGGYLPSFSELDNMCSPIETQCKGSGFKNEDGVIDGEDELVEVDGDGLVETCDNKVSDQEEKESFFTMWYAAADYFCLPPTTTGGTTTMVDDLCLDIGPEKLDNGSKSIADTSVEGESDHQTIQRDHNPTTAAAAPPPPATATATTTAPATATATTTLLKKSPLAYTPKFARVATYPPTSTDQETLARAFVTSQRQAFRPPESDEARRAREKELKKARASAAKKVNKVTEDKISAYQEEMKWMDANLKQENKKNNDLSAQVAKLKQDIVIAQAQLKKDVYVARSEAQHALDERNATITKMEHAISTLNTNIDEERTAKSKWIDDATVARTEAQRAVDERNSKIDTMGRAIEELNANIEAERSARDEAMHVAQIDAQVAMEAWNEEIENTEMIIASLRLNVDIERKMRDDAEKVVADRNEEMEASSTKQKTMLENLEANLQAGEIENLELNAKVAELKDEILAAQAKQQALDEVNACLAEEAQMAKDAADAKIKEQTEALKEMESNWKSESQQNADLNAHISELKGEINDARTKQEELDEVARRTKEEAEKRIQEQTEVLKKTESKLKNESKQNHALDAKIEKLTKSISQARTEQKSLDEDAQRIKDEAGLKIEEQTKALEEMEENWNSESEENGTLKDLIARLKEDIASAKAEQRWVEKVKAEATEEARRAKEEAEERTSTQTEALEKMEFSLRDEAQTRSTLNTQVEQLKSDNSQLKRVVSCDRREKQEIIDATTAELKRVEQAIEMLKDSESKLKTDLNAQIDELKINNTDLQRARSTDRKVAQKTIDAQNQELKKVENAILRLKANIAREYKLRDEAIKTKSGAEPNLQKKIDSISDKIFIAQKSYEQKLKVARTISMDTTRSIPQGAYFESDAVEVSYVLDDEEENGTTTEEEEEEEGDLDADNCTVNSEMDESRERSSYSTNGASTGSARAGKKVGWFRKMLAPSSNDTISTVTDDDLSMESSVPADMRRRIRKKRWLRAKRWSRGGAGRGSAQSSTWADAHRQWAHDNRSSRLSEYSLEDDIIDEDGDTMADDQDTYASDTEASQSYTISYSESGAETLGSAQAAESDDDYTCASLPPTPREMTPRGSIRGDGSIKWSKPVAPASSTGADLQRTCSSSSIKTDSFVEDTIGDNTLGTDIGRGSSEEEHTGVMSWFGFGNKEVNDETDHIGRNSDMLFQ